MTTRYVIVELVASGQVRVPQ